MGLTTFILTLVTITKGLKHGLHLSMNEPCLLLLIISIASIVFCYFYFRSESFKNRVQGGTFGGVEKVFSILMLLTACSMAFAHGSNDVANAIGPLSAVVSIVEKWRTNYSQHSLSVVDSHLGATGIVIGLAVMGYKVMGTIGTGITDLTPSQVVFRRNLLLRLR